MKTVKMKTTQKKIGIAILLMAFGVNTSHAQYKLWTLEDCINYALIKNIQIQQADLTNDKNKLNSGQAKANRLPALNAAVRQNFNWYKGFDSSTGEYGSSAGSNSTSYSLSSTVSIFNGQKLNSKIKQAGIVQQAGYFYSETVKESVGLSILNAYLQTLYASESVGNAAKQIEATTGQLALAKERLELGAISMSDFLQIKSELAAERSTLAEAQSQWSTCRITLMQLMELPVDENFSITSPNLDSLLVRNSIPDPQKIYNLALGIKPQIKNAELNRESAALDVKIAKADAIPNLSMEAGLSSSYSSLTAGSGYSSQLKNKINPGIGLSLSIPVFQKKQVKTNIAIASIAVSEAELEEINTKNQLRKEIEQACANVVSAQSKYAASLEENRSAQESHEVSTEKFKQGLLNSVDYLFEKTNLIASESKFLQSKYNLIFSYKVLDFYKGILLAL
jgi:outer membrane protein